MEAEQLGGGRAAGRTAARRSGEFAGSDEARAPCKVAPWKPTATFEIAFAVVIRSLPFP